MLQFLAAEEEEWFEKLRRYMEESFLTSLLINSNEKSSLPLFMIKPHKWYSQTKEQKTTTKEIKIFEKNPEKIIVASFCQRPFNLRDKLCVLDD